MTDTTDTPDPDALVIGEFGGVPYTPLEDLMRRFVALHAGRHRQRTPAWLADKAGSVGGSEVAALMGRNPYCTFEGVVASKVGARVFTGNIACRWGTLLESAIERYVEVDCGTRLAGTDISVPAPAGSGLEGRHANSPDGYGVVTLYAPAGEPDSWRLLTTDTETQRAAAGRPTKRVIALFEFKCPYSRKPKGGAPKQYKPQLWSGLALSPVAHLGLFVDAAFRKCALWNLGPTTGYDRSYHREKPVARWSTPVAWGFTAVYAPRLDSEAARGGAPGSGPDDGSDDGLADFDGGDAGGIPVNAAYEGWLMHYEYFGLPYETPQEAERAGRPFAPDPVDFGDCDKGLFEKMMMHLDKGRFRAEHVGPCLPDGRGAPLGTGREVGAAVDRAAAAPPRGHYLLGVLPWKLLAVDYAFVQRREGFLAEIAPLIHSCLDLAERFRAEADPVRAFRAHMEKGRMAGWAAGAKKGRGAPDVSFEQVQDLFDEL